MAMDSDFQAYIEKLLGEDGIGFGGIEDDVRKLARFLYSSDIVLYNTIRHYQYTHRIIDHYTPKSIPAGYPDGDIEFGPFYYWLTTEQPPADWSDTYKFIWYALQFVIIYEMGPSNITHALYADLKSYVATTGIAAGDGTLIGEDMYQALDKHWLYAAIHYLYYKHYPEEKAAFNASMPDTIRIGGENTHQVTVAIIGDWGTGNYDPDKPYQAEPTPATGPAYEVMAAVQAKNPDYIIHLGDTYYAGTDNKAIISPKEEQDNLVDLWSAYSGRNNFTLNSNHEMYDGANGYFHVALASSLFPKQQGRSFFALEFGPWVILGLDSAYYCDDDNLYMNGRITDKTQKQLLKKYQGAGKKMILMTHHNAISIDGAMKNQLWKDVTGSEALGAAPDFWYWGHIHDGIVYSDASIVGSTTKARCVGHSAMSYGEAWGLNKARAVEYFAHTPVDPKGQSNVRVYNGFAMLTLTKDALTEVFYEMNASKQAVSKWSKTTQA